MSIRSDLIRTSPFSHHLDQNTDADPMGDDALAYAIEGHFRLHVDYGAIDGFKEFFILEETETKLSFVGRAYFLEPYHLVPMEVSFQKTEKDISFRMLLAREKSVPDISENKLWKAIYLYATEGYAPPWDWGRPISGVLN